MTRFVDRIDEWKPSTMLKINMGIAFFILLAHIGGALILISESQEPKPSLLSLLYLDDLVAFLIFATSLVGLIKKQTTWGILHVHTIILLLLAIGWIYWSFTLAIGGPPKGNFVWNPILFAFLCAYPIYLLRRTFLASYISKSWFLNYSHVLIAMGSLVVSGLIIYKIS